MSRRLDGELLAAAQSLAGDALSAKKRGEYWARAAKSLGFFFACERVTLFQASGERLVSRHADGAAAPLIVDGKEGLAGAAAVTRKPCLTNDPYSDKRFSKRIDEASGRRTKNILAVPLLARQSVVGVVELLDKPGGFSQDDVDALEALAPQLTAAFALAAIEERQDQLEGKLLQQEKLAAIGRLVAGFTHDVRGPLTVILGFAQQLQEQLQDRQLASYADRIEKNGRRIEAMVKNLLGFSRVSRATVGPVDLPAVIENVLELVNMESRWAKTKIVKDFSASSPQVVGNANTLMQVFLNLIGNALQAMEGRPNSLLTLTVGPARDGKSVIAQVADNGPGIAPEARERIFEPFFTTKGNQGTGLGLYLVREIVDNHSGKIDVASTLGRGTAFTLSFPAVPAPPRRTTKS